MAKKKWDPTKIQIPKDWRDRYLSVEQAAAILNDTPKTLYNRNSREDGPPYYRIGGRCKYYGKELEQFIQDRKKAQL